MAPAFGARVRRMWTHSWVEFGARRWLTIARTIGATHVGRMRDANHTKMLDAMLEWHPTSRQTGVQSGLAHLGMPLRDSFCNA